MSSSRVPPSKGEILSSFKEGLDIPIKTSEDMEKVIVLMEKLLAGGSFEPMEIPEEERALVDKVVILQSMMDQPNVSSVNAIAIKILKGQMLAIVLEKVEQLKSLKACKELYQYILPELSSDAIQYFVTTVEGFYSKGLSENFPPEKALASALAKGILTSFVAEPDINKNTALRITLESDEALQDYICGIIGDFVGSDAVFLHREGSDNSSQRYHRSEIETWLATHDTDPFTRSLRTTADIQADPEAEEVIGNAGRSWIDSKMKDIPSSFEVRVLANKSLLLAIAIAYPLVKERYETVLEGSRNIEKTIEKVEFFAEDVIGLFTFLAEGIRAHVEEVPFACYPYVEEFMRQAAEKVKTGTPLETVKDELEGKTHVFIDFFHRIESTPLSSFSKKEVLAIAGDAIREEKPPVEVEMLFLEYIRSVEMEEIIRKECPGSVMGSKEWSFLGVAQKAPPLSEKILAALHEPSPSDPTKEAWQTGMLVLIPKTVDGKPLTLNRLGELVKKHFPSNQVGYRFMSPAIFTKYGNNSAEESHWVLIEKDVLPGSRNKKIEQQKAMIKAPYGLPELLPVTIGMILKYLNSADKERLFGDRPWTYTRCKEMIEEHHTIVGGFGADGFWVNLDDCGYDYDGVAPQRELDP